MIQTLLLLPRQVKLVLMWFWSRWWQRRFYFPHFAVSLKSCQNQVKSKVIDMNKKWWMQDVGALRIIKCPLEWHLLINSPWIISIHLTLRSPCKSFFLMVPTLCQKCVLARKSDNLFQKLVKPLFSGPTYVITPMQY